MDIRDLGEQTKRGSVPVVTSQSKDKLRQHKRPLCRRGARWVLRAQLNVCSHGILWAALHFMDVAHQQLGFSHARTGRRLRDHGLCVDQCLIEQLGVKLRARHLNCLGARICGADWGGRRRRGRCREFRRRDATAIDNRRRSGPGWDGSRRWRGRRLHSLVAGSEELARGAEAAATGGVEAAVTGAVSGCSPACVPGVRAMKKTSAPDDATHAGGRADEQPVVTPLSSDGTRRN